MNNSNKTDPKPIANTETAKVNNKPVITTEPELKKPAVDVKKPEVPEKAPIFNDKEPIVPVKESGITDQIIPVVAKPESVNTETTTVINKPVISTQPELKKPTVDINKPDVPEKAPIAIDKESIVPAKESIEPVQLIPVVTKPEPAKTESANPEKSKNPTKSDKAKEIYNEMVKDPKNDRSAIIAKIKKDLVLTKAGALSYFYKFQKESGRAQTVEGCWFKKGDGLVHAKMRRKKDGKTWEQELNFNDGSWASNSQPHSEKANPITDSSSFIYFAAETPPTADSIPPEAPLCYRFNVKTLEEQLNKLKKKYGDSLFGFNMEPLNNGTRSLTAERKGEQGEILTYRYYESSEMCMEYQKSHLKASSTDK